MNKYKFLAAAVISFVIMGCSPKLDTSSYEAAEASVEKISKSLYGEKKEKFGEMVKFYSLGEENMLCPMCAVNAVMSGSAEELRQQALERLSQFDGMTFEEMEKRYDVDYPEFVAKVQTRHQEEIQEMQKRREDFIKSFDSLRR